MSGQAFQFCQFSILLLTNLTILAWFMNFHLIYRIELLFELFQKSLLVNACMVRT